MDWVMPAAGIATFVLVFVLLAWALRRHRRMFPRGFDRTGWSPEPGDARSYETRTTNYSGGQDSGIR